MKIHRDRKENQNVSHYVAIVTGKYFDDQNNRIFNQSIFFDELVSFVLGYIVLNISWILDGKTKIMLCWFLELFGIQNTAKNVFPKLCSVFSLMTGEPKFIGVDFNTDGRSKFRKNISLCFSGFIQIEFMEICYTVKGCCHTYWMILEFQKIWWKIYLSTEEMQLVRLGES